MTVTTLPTSLTSPVGGPPATNQTAGPRDLTAEQVTTLLAPINPTRVQTLNRQSHVEAWDVRRWLNRTFGFAGWSIETMELVCVSEREINPGRWTVIYRAQVRLTVKTPDGRPLSWWEDAAMGDSRNQPSLGDAHDMAMKTSLSQALKRCAVNLGDQFGLSLYNDGSRRAVVQWSAVHTAPKDPEDAAAEDEPVKPEQAPEQLPAAPAPASEQQPPAPRTDATARQQQPAQQRRNFKAEAEAATSEEQFKAIRAAAVKAGAPPQYLATLDAIADGKRADARAPQRPPSRVEQETAGPAPYSAADAAAMAPVVKAAEQADAAEQALRLAASRANLVSLDADFQQVYGVPIAQATAVQLHAFRAKIEGAA
ncbi:Rad52/Rad22 family DNA repair protein [Streptomyces sp. NPDC012693]|uniref:Rad52/Rad22 family DNA repair protein n=1 Tax=Streptomyces sp. NPDC012693 TaxID=3364844 RepID=UPI003678C5FE